MTLPPSSRTPDELICASAASTRAQDAAPSLPPPNPQSIQTLQALMSLFGSVKAAMRQELQASEPAVSPVMLSVLRLCQRHPGISQQGLVQMTGRDKGQLARLVKELLDAGMLTREAHPDDKRSYQLQVSPAGQAACEAFALAEQAVAARLFGQFSAEKLQAFGSELNSLREQLKQHLK